MDYYHVDWKDVFSLRYSGGKEWIKTTKTSPTTHQGLLFADNIISLRICFIGVQAVLLVDVKGVAHMYCVNLRHLSQLESEDAITAYILKQSTQAFDHPSSSTPQCCQLSPLHGSAFVFRDAYNLNLMAINSNGVIEKVSDVDDAVFWEVNEHGVLVATATEFIFMDVEFLPQPSPDRKEWRLVKLTVPVYEEDTQTRVPDGSVILLNEHYFVLIAYGRAFTNGDSRFYNRHTKECRSFPVRRLTPDPTVAFSLNKYTLFCMQNSMVATYNLQTGEEHLYGIRDQRITSTYVSEALPTNQYCVYLTRHEIAVSSNPPEYAAGTKRVMQLASTEQPFRRITGYLQLKWIIFGDGQLILTTDHRRATLYNARTGETLFSELMGLGKICSERHVAVWDVHPLMVLHSNRRIVIISGKDEHSKAELVAGRLMRWFEAVHEAMGYGSKTR